jgi:DNA polymerase-3 subunit gamma/tau
MARALYAGAEFVSGGASSLTLSFQGGVPLAKCEQHRPSVEAALSDALGRSVTVELTHGGSAAPARGEDPAPAPAVPAPLEEDEIDLDDLVDAPPEAHKSGIDRLAEAFPGSELVEESP